MRKGAAVFGRVLLFSFIFTLVVAFFTTALSLIDFEWQGELYRFVIWPIAGIIFTFGLFYIVDAGKTNKGAMIALWGLIKSGDRAALFIIYLFLVFSNWLPNLITRSVANIYYRNYYVPNSGNKIGFTEFSVNYSSQSLGGIIETILLTMFVGALLYLMRMNERGT